MFPLQRHGSFEESMNNSKRGLFSLDLNLKWEINDSKPTSIKWMDCKFFSAHPDDLTNQNILHFKLRAENKALFYSISFLGFALLGSKQMPYLLVCHQLHLMSLSLSTTCVWPLAQIFFFFLISESLPQRWNTILSKVTPSFGVWFLLVESSFKISHRCHTLLLSVPQSWQRPLK